MATEPSEAEGMAVEHREKTGSSWSYFSDGERQERAEGLSQHGTALCETGKQPGASTVKGRITRNS